MNQPAVAEIFDHPTDRCSDMLNKRTRFLHRPAARYAKQFGNDPLRPSVQQLQVVQVRVDDALVHYVAFASDAVHGSREPSTADSQAVIDRGRKVVGAPEQFVDVWRRVELATLQVLQDLNERLYELARSATPSIPVATSRRISKKASTSS